MQFPQSVRPRVLIAEDDVATALHLEAHLRQAGFEPVGPAFDVQGAADLIVSDKVEAAILDVGLVAASIERILRPLAEMRTPLILLTGYAETELPPWAPDDAQFCMKPCALDDVLQRLETALARVADKQIGHAVSSYGA